MNIKTLSIDLLITNRCSLNCLYCVENEYSNFHNDPSYDNIKHYTKNEIYNFIDKILESKFFKDNYNVLDIHLWGGEPTLDTNFIIDIVNHYINNNNVIFMISTNGYKVNKLLEFIKEPRRKKLATILRSFYMLQRLYSWIVSTHFSIII